MAETSGSIAHESSVLSPPRVGSITNKHEQENISAGTTDPREDNSDALKESSDEANGSAGGPVKKQPVE